MASDLSDVSDLTDDQLNAVIAREAKMLALQRIRAGTASSQIITAFGKTSDDEDVLDRRYKEARVRQLETRSEVDSMNLENRDSVNEVMRNLRLYQGRRNDGD